MTAGGIDYGLVERARHREEYAEPDDYTEAAETVYDGPQAPFEPDVDPVPIRPPAAREAPSQPLVYSVAELAAFESADEAYIVG